MSEQGETTSTSTGNAPQSGQSAPGPAGSVYPPGSGPPDSSQPEQLTLTSTPAPHTPAPPSGPSQAGPGSLSADVDAPAAPADVDAVEPESKPDPRIAELEAQQRKLAEQIERQRRDALNTALDRLGIPAKYRALAPDVDPFSDKGRAALDQFAADHPEIARPRSTEAPAIDPARFKDRPGGHLVSVDKIAESKRILRRQRTS